MQRTVGTHTVFEGLTYLFLILAIITAFDNHTEGIGVGTSFEKIRRKGLVLEVLKARRRNVRVARVLIVLIGIYLRFYYKLIDSSLNYLWGGDFVEAAAEVGRGRRKLGRSYLIVLEPQRIALGR